MCRPKSQGGRRCPSHTDPIKRAARNAKKREQYRQDKIAMIERLMSEDLTGTPVSHAVTPETFQNQFLSRELKDKKLSELYKVKNTSKNSEKINIHSTDNEGYLVDRHYFAPKKVTGKIDYLNLDENSYKEFGFQEVNDDYYKTRSERVAYDEIIELSEIETESFDERDKLAISYYTSDEYKWFNEALYTDGISISSHTKLDRNLFEDGEQKGYIKIDHDEKTKEAVKVIANQMDKALDKGPKIQRILYRGASDNSDLFRKHGGIKRWMDEKVTLGQELKFDNYQSTSVDYDTAYNYTSSTYSSPPGLIYEILTPEGVNITAKSQFDDEYEVLLPRDSRYMVVGKHYNAKKDDRGRLVHVLQLVAMNEDGDILDGTNESEKKELFKEIKI